MQAHREAEGNLYDLGLTDPANESRNKILLNANGQFKPLFCRHCAQPKCVAACMSGALTKNPDTGFVRYDADKCGSCFMCVMSCSFGVPKPDAATRTRVVKCDFCVNDNDEPNCVKRCPSGTITVEAYPREACCATAQGHSANELQANEREV